MGPPDPSTSTQGWQEIVLVAVEQRGIPADLPPEAGVAVSPYRQIALEESLQAQARLAGEPAQQRCLVLDRMSRKVGHAYWRLHGTGVRLDGGHGQSR